MLPMMLRMMLSLPVPSLFPCERSARTFSVNTVSHFHPPITCVGRPFLIGSVSAADVKSICFSSRVTVLSFSVLSAQISPLLFIFPHSLPFSSAVHTDHCDTQHRAERWKSLRIGVHPQVPRGHGVRVHLVCSTIVTSQVHQRLW